METLQRTANRGSISTGYDIDNSLKLEADNTERMQRTYANITSAGTPTSTKIATISFWIKRTELQPSGNHLIFIADANFTWVGFSNDRLYILGSTAGINLISTAVFRDTSAWYHIVVAFDTTQSTASNRVKAYVNGEQVTVWGGNENFGTQNNDIDLYDTNTSHYLGWSDAQSQSGYYSEFYLIDGQQLAPTEFGETDSDSGIWKPKAYGGTFGVQGYHLDFEDSSALGDDVSGNGNNFTALYNITAADQATDTPTNNFCIFNPLVRVNNNPTISEGGTKVTGGGGTWNQAFGTLGAKKGKWYYEVKIANSGDTAYYGASTFPAIPDNVSSGQLMYNTSFMVGTVASPDYYYWQNGSQVSNESTGWGSIAQNDVIGVALDLDASTKTFTIYKNGTALSGTLSQPVDLPTNMQDEFIFPMVVQYEDSDDQYNLGGYTIMSISSAASDANGYGTFEYAPPSGYYALCTKNLAEYG